MSTIDSIDLLYKRQKRRLEAVETLRNLLLEFPDLLDDLFGLKTGELTGIAVGGVKVGRPPRSGTAYQRIARTFILHNNEWLDTGLISRESDVARNAVASVLWSLHKGDFERKDHATHKRMKVWRMTPERFDIVKNQERLFDEESKPVEGISVTRLFRTNGRSQRKISRGILNSAPSANEKEEK